MKKRCLVSLWGVLLTAFLAIFLGVWVGAETYNGTCGSQLTWSIGNTQTVASHDFSSAMVTQNNISFGGLFSQNPTSKKK